MTRERERVFLLLHINIERREARRETHERIVRTGAGTSTLARVLFGNDSEYVR